MPIDPEMQEKLRQLDQAQKKITQFPDGKSTPDDQGATHYAIAADTQRRLVVIQYSKPIAWIGLDLQSAKALRDKLTEKISVLEN